MGLHKTGLKFLSGISMAALLVAAWVAFAPAQVGGRASYVIVNGNSMEPKLHKGDLVITRETEDYGVGDIAAYRHPEIGPVIHRVFERDGERFVFKGDNNSWLDSYKPSGSEFIGKAWIEVPSAGGLFGRLRSPGGMAALAGMMGVIAMTTVARDKRKQTGSARPPASRSAGPARPPGGGYQEVVMLLAAVMLASLVLGFFAFGRPASRTVSEDIGYEHRGGFSYSADAPSGIYDRDEVQTGAPVFTRITNQVDVRFSYLLSQNAAAENVEGDYRLIAEVREVESGWKRTVLLQPYTRFTGGFTAMGALDLTELRKLINGMERRTGFHSDRYAVSVVPEVSAQSTLAGREFEDEFAPRLDFWLDDTKLQLQTSTEGADPPQASGDAAPLEPSREGSVERASIEPNTLRILFFDLGVSTARKLSLLGLALSAGGLAWFGVPLMRALRGDEPERIRSRYGPLLVSMRGGDIESGGRTVEVSAFEDLARLAEKSGQSILHRGGGSIHDYYPRCSDVTYHYRAVAPGDSPPTMEAPE